MALVMKIQFTDVICDNSLKNTWINGNVSGYEFEVRLGYYRGLYLSCMEELAVTVDGKEVNPEAIVFCLNGKEFGASEIHLMASEFWPVIVPAKVKIYQSGGLEQGDHHVLLKMMFRSPYLPNPGSMKQHDYVPIDSCGEKTLSLNA